MSESFVSLGHLLSRRDFGFSLQDELRSPTDISIMLHDSHFALFCTEQVLKGNIRVMCRVRPAQPGQKSVITYPLEGLLTVNPGDKRPQEFEFDHVFGPESTQVGSVHATAHA